MYTLLEQLTLQAAFPLAALCETLEVSRAGYYAWRSESQSAQQERERELTPLVCDIFWIKGHSAAVLQAQAPQGLDSITDIHEMESFPCAGKRA